MRTPATPNVIGSVKRLLSRVAWFSIPVAMAFFTVPRLVSGFASESAFPVPAYISMNVVLPRATYAAAIPSLEKINSGDGSLLIVRAEAKLRAGLPPSIVLPILEQGLAEAPASPRGWTLAADLYAHTQPERAGRALAFSFNLDKPDYWLAEWRIEVAARLWETLPTDVKEKVLEQVRMLWQVSILRPHLENFLELDSGRRMVTLAFARDPQSMREINRWRVLSHMEVIFRAPYHRPRI